MDTEPKDIRSFHIVQNLENGNLQAISNRHEFYGKPYSRPGCYNLSAAFSRSKVYFFDLPAAAVLFAVTLIQVWIFIAQIRFLNFIAAAFIVGVIFITGG